MRFTVSLVKEAGRAWQHDGALQLGAALSYYGVLSLAPLLTLVATLGALVIGQQATEAEILTILSDLVGLERAQVLFAKLAGVTLAGSLDTIVIALIILILGAAGFFGQLRFALNTVLHVPQPHPKRLTFRQHVAAFLRSTLTTYAALFILSIFFVGVLILGSAVTAIGAAIGNFWPLIQLPFIAIVTTGMFALLMHTLPSEHPSWPATFGGAALSAILFTLGQLVLGYIVGRGVAATFSGTAGALIAVMIWTYYSAQIFLFGAVVTRLLGEREP